MSNSSRPHDDAVVELLREDPEQIDEYLAAALEEADKQGGHQALLAALRHVAEAQGIENVAEREGNPRQSEHSDPTTKTLPTHRRR